MLRNVVGRIDRGDGSPWVNGAIVFTLLSESYTADTIYPRSEIRVITDQNGEFSQPLWANAAGLSGSDYECRLPSGEVFRFDLPVGSSDINLSEVRS